MCFAGTCALVLALRSVEAIGNVGVERTVDVLVGAQLASSIDGGIGIGRELSLGVQRIMRFRNATNKIMFSGQENLDKVLYQNGYSDHSHFNHEFHNIVGISPTEYIASLETVRKRGGLTVYRSYHAAK